MGQIDREITGANRRLAKKRVQCLNGALCFVLSSVLADSLVLRNPLLRQAPNRCMPCEKRATAQIAHLVFADTQANAEKPKELFFCQRSTEIETELNE